MRRTPLCRPPGHHTRREAAGGFCYLNNAAIAAERYASASAESRSSIPTCITAKAFRRSFTTASDVLYASIHGDPTNFYPAVAGFQDERGVGAGEGYNLNLPMPHGSSEAFFLDRLGEALDALRAYRAEVIVLCLGFDIYQLDPQSKVAVTAHGFEQLGARIRQLELPCLIIQEGGYHLESLGANARAFFASPSAWSIGPSSRG